LGWLQAHLEPPGSVIEVVRGSNTSLDPHQIGVRIVWRAGEWLSALKWSVVVPDVDEQLAVLAEVGLASKLHHPWLRSRDGCRCEVLW